jgi:hypothetical protein
MIFLMPHREGGSGLGISIRQLEDAFAGEVTGVDSRTPLSSDGVAAIHASMDHTPFWYFAIKSYRIRSNCGLPCILTT